MQASENIKQFIKSFEGLRLNAYLCPSNIWTIGYGHTGPDVYKGRYITQQQADLYFNNDIKIHENNVSKLVKVPLTQNQFDALVSLEYNIGYGNLSSSTLLKLLNQGKYQEAGFRFLFENQNAKTPEEKYKGCFVFNNQKKVLFGLVKRRFQEQNIFFKT